MAVTPVTTITPVTPVTTQMLPSVIKSVTIKKPGKSPFMRKRW